MRCWDLTRTRCCQSMLMMSLTLIHYSFLFTPLPLQSSQLLISLFTLLNNWSLWPACLCMCVGVLLFPLRKPHMQCNAPLKNMFWSTFTTADLKYIFSKMQIIIYKTCCRPAVWVVFICPTLKLCTSKIWKALPNISFIWSTFKSAQKGQSVDIHNSFVNHQMEKMGPTYKNYLFYV